MRLETADELLSVLDELRSRDPSEGWIFRGHAHAKWELVPRALRPGRHYPMGPALPFGDHETHREQLAGERAIVALFACLAAEQKRTDIRPEDLEWARNLPGPDDRLPELWPPKEHEQLFALAQHAGVPTRLLDWTTESSVAAYFAASEAGRLDLPLQPHEGTVAVWALSRRRVEEAIRDQQPIPRFSLRVFSGANPYALAQSGLLSVLDEFERDPRAYATGQSLDFLLGPHGGLGRSYSDEPMLLRYELPWSQTGALLRTLSHRGVSAVQMYPSLEGIAKGVVERTYWDRA